MIGQPAERVGRQIGTNLPFLRRFARFLTGSQAIGDRLVHAAREAILTGEVEYDRSINPKVALFRAFQEFRHTFIALGEEGEKQAGSFSKAPPSLWQPALNCWEVLLLRTIEGFSEKETGVILRADDKDVSNSVSIAHEEKEKGLTGRVLIIEDEPVLALDLSEIARSAGLSVVGVARNGAEARQLAAEFPADLVLSEVRLAGGASGIGAVNGLPQTHGRCPVVFLTAAPERLLTGERPEPAFVISKPYTEEQVWLAVRQARRISLLERDQRGAGQGSLH
ncbi:response regulator [Leisingera daeponensis]|uniref:Response regulator n=1 Tax=Leisingera daeponensis TaxID=405746 RepID=A0ABS7NLV9_9RHOB|nr:response regulator [Leisingera daeponensis]MBY6142186.1 response regulator [Leisingera daeponensis]